MIIFLFLLPAILAIEISSADFNGQTSASFGASDCPLTLASGKVTLPASFTLTGPGASCVATCGGFGTFFDWEGTSLAISGLTVQNCSAGLVATGTSADARVSLTDVGFNGNTVGVRVTNVASLSWTGVTALENGDAALRTEEVRSLTLASGSMSDNGRIAVDDVTDSSSSVRSGSFSLADLVLDRNGLASYPVDHGGVLFAPRLGGKGLSLTRVTARGNRARTGIINLADCAGDITVDQLVVEDTVLPSEFDDGVTVRMTNLVGSLSIKNSRFARNIVGDEGALLHLKEARGVNSIVLDNVTITETLARVSEYGALYVSDMAGTRVDVIDCTFSNNTAKRVGAIRLDNVTAPVRISGTSPSSPARFLYNSPHGDFVSAEGAASIAAWDVDSLTLTNIEFVGCVGSVAGSVFARARANYRGRRSSFVATEVKVTDVTTSSPNNQDSGPAFFVRNYDTAILRDSTFQRCDCTEGSLGALYVTARESIALDRCTFLDNTAEGGTGGAFFGHADSGLEPEDGDGFPLASLRLANVTFEANHGRGDRSSTVGYDGGAMAIEDLAPVTIVDTRFASNGIDLGGDRSWVTRRGGAVYYGCDGDRNCTLDLNNCSFTSNFAPNLGGALAVNMVNTVTMTDVAVQGNAAWEAGGGVWLYGTVDVTLNRVLVENNVAGGTTHDSKTRGQGGGLWYDNDRTSEGTLLATTLVFTEVGFVANRAAGIGAGAFVEGAASLDMRQSAYLRNVALNGDAVEIERCGGGLHVNVGQVLVRNSTFEANVLLNGRGYGGGGGGLCVNAPSSSEGQLLLDHVYLVNNVAVDGAWAMETVEFGETGQLNVTRTSVVAGAPSSMPVVSFAEGGASPLSTSFGEVATGLPTSDRLTGLYSLAYSYNLDGTGPAPLDGARLPADRQFYVFANPRTNYNLRVTMAACYINGVLAHIDATRGHFDCVGTSGEGGTNVVLSDNRPTAGTLAPGSYVVTMEFFMQPYPEVINATFTVVDGADESVSKWSGDAPDGAAVVPFPTSIAGVPDPVAHWRLDEVAPATGSVAEDATGNGLAGSYVGSPATLRMTMPDGSVRVVQHFHSGSQYVVVPYDGALSTQEGESLTVTLWLYLCSSSNAYLVSAGGGWDLSLNENSMIGGVASSSSASAGEFRSFGRCGGVAQSAHGTNVISHGSWHFLVGRYEANPANSTLELSVDRSTTECPECTTSPGTSRFADCGNELWLGQRYDFHGADPLRGILADVRFYRDFLDDAALDALYLATGGSASHRAATEAAGTSITVNDWPPADDTHVCNYPLYRGADAAGASQLQDEEPQSVALLANEWPTLALSSSCACALDDDVAGIECDSNERRVIFGGYTTLQPASTELPCQLEFGSTFEGLDSACDAEDTCYIDPFARPAILYPPPPPTPAPPDAAPAPDGDGEGEGGLDEVPPEDRGAAVEDEGEVDHLLNAMVAFLVLFLIALSCAAFFAYTLHRLRKRGTIDTASVADSLELARFGAPGRRASRYVSARHGTTGGSSSRAAPTAQSAPNLSLSEVGDGGAGNYGSAPALLAKGRDGTYSAAPGLGMTPSSAYGEAPPDSSNYSVAPLPPRSAGSSAGTTGSDVRYGAVPDPVDGTHYGAAPPSKDPLSPRMRKSASSRRRKRTPSRPPVDDSNYAKIAFEQDGASRSGSAGTAAAYGAPPDALSPRGNGSGSGGGNYMDVEDAVRQ